MPRNITRYGLEESTLIAGKYEVIERIGKGWEGEVYRVRERRTGVERAAKLFYPQRNERNRAVRFHARKLHKLRRCGVLIQYHTQEAMDYDGHAVTVLISELVEGEQLYRFLVRQPGRRLHPFEGLHLLRALAGGVASIHREGEYHGDLHDENIIVRRHGVGFDIKLLDMQKLGQSVSRSRQDDVCDIVRIFYDAIGGRARYAAQCAEIKNICCGLRRTSILKRFRNAIQLKEHLDRLQWNENAVLKR